MNFYKNFLKIKSEYGYVVLFTALTLLLTILRIHVTRESSGAYTGCYDCLDFGIIKSDLPIIAILLILLGASNVIKSKYIDKIIFIAILTYLLVYAIDIGTTATLKQRLYFDDLLFYWSDITGVTEIGTPFLFSLTGIALISTTAATITALFGSLKKTNLFTATILASPLFLLSVTLQEPHFVHSAYYKNIALNNYTHIRAKKNNFRPTENTNFKLATPVRCFEPKKEKFDHFILLIIESLSHNHVFPSTTESLPMMMRLAELAKHNLTIENFHANGANTFAGLYALLTGRQPIHGIIDLEKISSHVVVNPYNKLSRLHAEQITTQYFTGENLTTYKIGEWVESIGFNHIEGPENLFYQGLPRGRGGASGDPGDSYLFKRFLNWYDTKPESDSRTFSVIQTISTHLPFIIPGKGKTTEREAFEYADRALLELVDGLASRNFFERGGLLITGDHRAMTPISKEDYSKHGKKSFSLIPGIFIGMSKSGRISNGVYSQLDVLPSVFTAMGLEWCGNESSGNFLFDVPQPPSFVLHSSGNDRTIVQAYLKGDETIYEISLLGANTNFERETPPPPLDKIILAFINESLMVSDKRPTGHSTGPARKAAQSGEFKR